MGEKLQNLEPREATCRAEARRRRKPFTRAKWEIRFQRFAISFRPSVKALVFGLPREAGSLLRGLPRGETLRGLSRCRVAKALRGFYSSQREISLFPGLSGNSIRPSDA